MSLVTLRTEHQLGYPGFPNIGLFFDGVLHFSGFTELLSAVGKKLLFVPVAQKYRTSDPDEPFGYDMQQEAAHELRRRQGHGFPAITVFIVLVPQTNDAILDIEDSVIGDCHPVGVVG